MFLRNASLMNSIAIDSSMLRAGLEAEGLSVDEKTIHSFLGYAALLLKWNRVYNLTAIRRPEEVLTHHLLDSAALVPWLRRVSPDAKNILDVGCGGGLPSVPVAILRPDLEVTGVDAVGKKAAFVNQAAIELGLRNLRARHSRVEKLQGEWDMITSRAFASLSDFVTLTRPLLSPSGRWLAMKGAKTEEEIAELPDGINVELLEPIDVPGLEETRHLIVLSQSLER